MSRLDDIRVTPAELNSVVIAEPDEAITFARIKKDSHLVAVLSCKDGVVEGIDLTRSVGTSAINPIDLLQEQGYDSLVHIIRTNLENKLQILLPDLGIPLILGNYHIAVGTNFPGHAIEVGADDGPFLFPKIVTPSAWNSPVNILNGLLDYEAEVAWVSLNTANEEKQDLLFGLILANDYTDRELLLNNVDPGNIQSGKGFTTSKSRPGFLPVGSFFVVPRDTSSFMKKLNVRLYVNNQLKQQSLLSDMIWGMDRILDEIWKKRDHQWVYQDKTVSLFADSKQISPNILILSGTPEGTIYSSIGLLEKIEAVFRWLLFGWNHSISQHAIGLYIKKARRRRIYLQPDDLVVVYVDMLGIIDNLIIE